MIRRQRQFAADVRHFEVEEFAHHEHAPDLLRQVIEARLEQCPELLLLQQLLQQTTRLLLPLLRMPLLKVRLLLRLMLTLLLL